MANLNFFTWGCELSPEARTAINDSCSNLADALQGARKAISILKNERCCSDRTTLEVSDHFRRLGGCLRSIETDIISSRFDLDSKSINGMLAIAEMKGIEQDLNDILDRFARVAEYLDLPSSETFDFGATLNDTQTMLEKYLGRDLHSELMEEEI